MLTNHVELAVAEQAQRETARARRVGRLIRPPIPGADPAALGGLFDSGAFLAALRAPN